MTRIALALLAAAALHAVEGISLLNASYDPTRELYTDLNAAFAAKWQAEKHQKVTIKQSHDGSGKQARKVIDGLEADVVTLALAYDIDAIAEKSKLLPRDWQKLLPDDSAPYTSTIVFLVRKGNPKGIRDWPDLVKPGIEVIPANPKTSGGARWTYLAAYGAALTAPGGSEEKAHAYVAAFYRNAPVLDTGARGASTTFVDRDIGDVLVGWENEVLLAAQQHPGEFEVVTPSASILAEPPVAVVEANAKRHGTLEAARAYLEFLYTPEAQEIAAKRFYRPRDAEVAKRHEKTFPAVQLFTIDQVFGGWTKAQAVHFADGGVFDQVAGQ